MKVQKLGWFIGVNAAAACLVLQGCKAVKPEDPRQPSPDVAITVEPEPVVQPAAQPVETEQTSTVPPPQVAAVKPLPPPPAPKPSVMPFRKKPAAPAPAAGTMTHTIARGETLSIISKKYNVRMAAILAANPGLKADKVRIGQKIAIPCVAAPAAEPPAAAPAAADAQPAPAAADAQPAVAAPAVADAQPVPTAANITAPAKAKVASSYGGPVKDYVVKAGDSLGKIAHNHGITIRVLKEMNGLKNDMVRIGQKLKVPAEKVSAPAKTAAVVKKPDEKPAAAAVKPPVAEAAAPVPVAKDEKPVENPQSDVVPAESTAPAATEAVVEEAAKTVDVAGPTYTVKDGDDIVSVAIAWGISPSQLMDLNGLKASDTLKPGQVLKLPADAKQAVQ